METSDKGKKDRYYCFRYAVVGYTERKGLNGNISKRYCIAGAFLCSGK